MMRVFLSFLILHAVGSTAFAATPTTTTTAADINKLPGIHVDMQAKQVRVDCEEIDCKNPLEFFCVVTGTNEHESVLRTKAQPSKIHLALLILGLDPGEGAKYSEAEKKWAPPHGPPLNVSCEFEKDGKKVSVPAYRMMRAIRTKKEMSPLTWVFVGSRVMDDGHYAADVTGYVVSIVNFELTLIDVPELASSANETLEWEINTDVAPPGNTPVTMVIEPAGNPIPTAAQPTASASTTEPSGDVTINQPEVDRLVQEWTQKVTPHSATLQQAAQAQYDTITALRREQQRLIDEADRIQRTIDDLQKKYQDMTTPRPKTSDPEPGEPG
jgi:hypothetical protein